MALVRTWESIRRRVLLANLRPRVAIEQYVFKGKCDLRLLADSGDGLDDEARTVVVVELKKKVKSGDAFQAASELVGTSLYVQGNIYPIAVLTDLHSAWRFYWFADDDPNCPIATCALDHENGSRMFRAVLGTMPQHFMFTTDASGFPSRRGHPEHYRNRSTSNTSGTGEDDGGMYVDVADLADVMSPTELYLRGVARLKGITLEELVAGFERD